MKLRNLCEDPERRVLDFSGHGFAVSKSEATSLAISLANRALGRGVPPSPVDAVRLSGSRDGLAATVDVSDAEGLRTSLRVAGSARAWISAAVRIFATATGEPTSTLDDVLEAEFPEGGQA